MRLILPLCIWLAAVCPFVNAGEYFEKDAHGVLYFDREAPWVSNWRLKTNTVFRSIKLVLTDDLGQESIIVDEDKFIAHNAVEFVVRLGTSQIMTGTSNPPIAVPVGFSRISERPLGISDWAYMQGESVKEVVYNKDYEGAYDFASKGEIVLAHYTTLEAGRERHYMLKVVYEQ